MTIEEAQRDVRTVFLGGFAGQIVSGTMWAISAALATWGTPRRGMLVLVLGGMFIFPLTQLLLRAMGRRASLGKGHPMNQLATQVALTVPLSLPLVGAVILCRPNWFYPALALIVGAHYLPFMFLYGMWQFGVLAAILIAGSLIIGMYVPSFTLAGWFTAAVLLAFAFVGLAVARRTEGARTPA